MQLVMAGQPEHTGRMVFDMPLYLDACPMQLSTIAVK